MWLYQGVELSEVPTEAISFVYIITNLESGMKYIGKKGFWSKKTKLVNGKKKKVTSESDWRKYYGSNDRIKADVKEIGKDKFKREILHVCPSLGVASYLESKEMFMQGALERDDFYNIWLSVMVRQDHIKSLQIKTGI